MSGELRTRQLPRLMGRIRSATARPGKATTQKHPNKTQRQNSPSAKQVGELVRHAPDYCKTSLGYMVRLRNTERQCIVSECSQDQAGNRNMVAAKGKAGGPRRLPTHHIEKTQWSPTWNVICLGNGLPWATIANLCRNRVQHLEAVGTFPPADLPCHPCQSLCSVLDGQTVSGVARIPRVRIYVAGCLG